MPTTHTNKTSTITITPTMTTEPERAAAEAPPNLPRKLPDYDPPVSTGSGPSGSSGSSG